MPLDDMAPLELVAEKSRLEITLREIRKQIPLMEKAINRAGRGISDIVAYAAATRSEGDAGDIASLAALIEQESGVPVIWSKLLGQLRNMEPRAYFGRIDFKAADDDAPMSIYIGTGWLYDSTDGHKLVFDWRTPVCNMYYQFDPGPARYKSPDGPVRGEMTLKRTYEIDKDILLDVIDSGDRANDEILRDLLRRSTDGKMRTIVQTIQREQDDVIRNEQHPILLVQGSAGSGKTSVALHRVAYLLYAERGAASTANVMMLSPNPVFKDYISTVLPQLGEENVQESTFRDVALTAFPLNLAVEAQWEQIEYALANPAPSDEEGATGSALDARALSMQYKSSRSILAALERYSNHVAANFSDFPDLSLDDGTRPTPSFPGRLLREAYDELANQPIQSKLNRAKRTAAQWLANYIRQEREIAVDIREKTDAAGRLSFFTIYRDARSVPPRLHDAAAEFLSRLGAWGNIDLRSAYSGFYTDDAPWAPGTSGSADRSKWNRMCAATREALSRDKMFYEDLAPYSLLALSIAGVPSSVTPMRHVVIDEMQDYTPAEYRTLRGLFPNARLTMLGDLNQALNPLVGRGSYTAIVGLPGSRPATDVKYVELFRSYRSTAEITDFASAILGPEAARKVETIGRHGDKPVLAPAENQADAPRVIAAIVRQLAATGARSIALICKTASAAESLHATLTAQRRPEPPGSCDTPDATCPLLPEARLVMPYDTKFTSGTVVLPTYMAKGLEFDAVVVCDADADAYGRSSLRRVLYTACTRALHHLALVYVGAPSPLLPLDEDQLYTMAPNPNLYAEKPTS